MEKCLKKAGALNLQDHIPAEEKNEEWEGHVGYF